MIKQDFINILIKNQQQLKAYMKGFLLEHYDNDKVYDRDGFLLAAGDLPITLVAHLDTVHHEQVTLDNIVITDDLTISSPVGIGGDDRNGVFIIHDLIKDGYRPHILLTEDEEIGLVGAKKFIREKDNKELHKLISNSKYLLQLDRRGYNEAVFYACDNKEFQNYILSFGFEKGIGTSTDIIEIGPFLDIASVNLSCGYYNAHTREETIKYKEVILTKKKVIELFNDLNNIEQFSHE